MTKEKLEKEAEEYAEERCKDCYMCSADGKRNKCHFYTKRVEGYLAGAEPREKRIAELEKENAELRRVAEFQQSSNMNRHFENKKLKEGLAVGSTFNKALNSMNKTLEEERNKYRNMVFDKDDQLTKAKELLERLLVTSCNSDVLNLLPNCSEVLRVRVEAEQFLSEVKK